MKEATKKISDVAKELGIPSKEAVGILKEMGSDIKTSASRIDEKTIKQLQLQLKNQTPKGTSEEISQASASPRRIVRIHRKADGGTEVKKVTLEKEKAAEEKLEEQPAPTQPASTPSPTPSPTPPPSPQKEGRKGTSLEEAIKASVELHPELTFISEPTAPLKEEKTDEKKPKVFTDKDRYAPQEIQKIFFPIGGRRKKRSKKNKAKQLQEQRALEEARAREEAAKALEEGELRIVPIRRDSYTVGELSSIFHIAISEIIPKLMNEGILITINQKLSWDLIEDIANKFNIVLEVEKEKEQKSKLETKLEEEDLMEELEGEQKERPPIITIMGHVDHGKTKLLDKIRNTNVVDTEEGGITQHIGAYQVVVNGRKQTFLDTPGHEAFTSLRARGSQVTDVAIIVVAADDGVMPQTIEAIDHAKAAGVTIMVAVNKIDKPDANQERVLQQLTEHEIVSEKWGGKHTIVPVSAITGVGVEELLEMINLISDLKELKAISSKKATGVIIEANLSKQRGAIATVLVQNGSLHIGDSFVIGHTFGKVRAMFDDHGQEIKEAGPSTPVVILGINEVPNSGEKFQVVANERTARTIADSRLEKEREKHLKARELTLESISKKIKEGEIKELKLILKADVKGSLEALDFSLKKIEMEGVQLKIIHSATGIVSESDVMLAKASEAIIVAFNVEPSSEASQLADDESVAIRSYKIIYKLLDDIKHAMQGLLEPEYEEVETGKIEIRSLFKSSKTGTIAGCFVTDGKIARNAKAKLMRANKEIFSGEISSLKRFKEDAKEVKSGYECGLTLAGFDKFEVGDIIIVLETKLKEI